MSVSPLQTPETASADSQKASIPASKPAGLFHGHVITELDVQAAAETLWNETYGDLAGLLDGTNYVLHLYTDGDCTVKLEDRMTETRHGEVYGAPVLSHRAELPEWADAATLAVASTLNPAQEAMDENCKAETIEAWADEIRANLDPIEEIEAAEE